MKLGKMFFILLQKLFPFSGKLKSRILDVQISWHYQMPKHKKEICLTEWLGKETQSVNEIWPVYILLQKKQFYKKTL